MTNPFKRFWGFCQFTRREYLRAKRTGTLAPPLTMLRRAAATPFILLFKVLFVASVAAGWGLDAARDSWDEGLL